MRRIPVLLAILVVTACSDSDPTRPPAASPALVDSTAVLVGAGNIARCLSIADEATAGLLDGIGGTVFTTGNHAYEQGSASNFTSCYGPSWGRHKARTRPAPGERDYATAGASGYFGYFGANAGDPSRGYYAYSAGPWRVIVLNSNIARDDGSAQLTWLRAELAAAAQFCTVAIWHHPRFTSELGGSTNNSVRPFWDALYEYGADLVLNGRDRAYERFAPMRPDGTADAALGIRQFTVGTGGVTMLPFSGKHPNSQTRNALVNGVLKLTLRTDGYAWQFVPIAAGLYSDSGSGSCHHPPGGPPNRAPIADAGGPYASTGSVTFDGSGSSDPDGDSLAYTWDFGDGSGGTGVAPTHTYTASGTYGVRLVVTDGRGGSAADSTTASITIPSQEPPAVIVGAGNIASCGAVAFPRAEATATLIDSIPGTVMALGDNVVNGTAEDYANCYHPTWGRHLSRTRAVLGNHEYNPGNATPSFDYFGDRVGPRDLGYYSFDVGAWHIIVLNDNRTFVSISAGSPQDQWLVNDLASTTKSCVLAVWHTALNISSNTAGYTRNESRKILWDRLYAAGADVVLNGQEHHYERMAPMRPDGTLDEATGLRQFNVGTGGESLISSTSTIHPASEVRGFDFGVLKLTLRSNSYDWEFVPSPGETFRDSGSGSCH
jgi:PKD repeat protein